MRPFLWEQAGRWWLGDFTGCATGRVGAQSSDGDWSCGIGPSGFGGGARFRLAFRGCGKSDSGAHRGGLVFDCIAGSGGGVCAARARRRWRSDRAKKRRLGLTRLLGHHDGERTRGNDALSSSCNVTPDAFRSGPNWSDRSALGFGRFFFSYALLTSNFILPASCRLDDYMVAVQHFSVENLHAPTDPALAFGLRASMDALRSWDRSLA